VRRGRVRAVVVASRTVKPSTRRLRVYLRRLRAAGVRT
jgi:hypothetical protein